MQCRYDVTLWSVRVAILAVETQRYISCFFDHYLINGTVFGKKIIEDKMCFGFFYNVVKDISYSKKNSARCYYKCTSVCMNRTRYSFQFLMKLEFSRQIYEKSSYIKFRENSSHGSRVVHKKGHTRRRKQPVFAMLSKCLNITPVQPFIKTLFYNIFVRVSSPAKTSWVKFIS
jgi:hypothetical protein